MTHLPGLDTDAWGASFDDHRTYRYTLWRRWDPALDRLATWIMLNPSTADEFENDPTIGRVIGFSRTWGYGGAIILNLYAFRTSDPAILAGAADPVGPRNDEELAYHAQRAAEGRSRVICAWGNHKAVRARAPAVLALLRAAGVASLCLGRTKDGQPRHPLYVRGDATPIQYVPA